MILAYNSEMCDRLNLLVRIAIEIINLFQIKNLKSILALKIDYRQKFRF